MLRMEVKSGNLREGLKRKFRDHSYSITNTESIKLENRLDINNKSIYKGCNKAKASQNQRKKFLVNLPKVYELVKV